MSIAELIAAVGPEHIQVQGLGQNLRNVRIVRDQGEITFTCPAEFAHQYMISSLAGTQPETVGMVIWIPRARIPA